MTHPTAPRCAAALIAPISGQALAVDSHKVGRSCCRIEPPQRPCGSRPLACCITRARCQTTRTASPSAAPPATCTERRSRRRCVRPRHRVRFPRTSRARTGRPARRTALAARPRVWSSLDFASSAASSSSSDQPGERRLQQFVALLHHRHGRPLPARAIRVPSRTIAAPARSSRMRCAGPLQRLARAHASHPRRRVLLGRRASPRAARAMKPGRGPPPPPGSRGESVAGWRCRPGRLPRSIGGRQEGDPALDQGAQRRWTLRRHGQHTRHGHGLTARRGRQAGASRIT